MHNADEATNSCKIKIPLFIYYWSLAPAMYNALPLVTQMKLKILMAKLMHK